MSRLWFSAGTAAELIKLFPLFMRAKRAGIPFATVSTGQSPQSFDLQWSDFGFDQSSYVRLVDSDHDLKVAKEAAVWFARAMSARKSRVVGTLKQLGDPQDAALWVVHGDTLSTLVGATWGKRLGLPIAHVEAGLRSRDFREPFPEELMRTLVGQIASLHFCPEARAVENLLRERARGEMIDTHGNTQLDAVEEALLLPKPNDMPEGRYGLVNIHRFETLLSHERREAVKRTLLAASEKHRLIVVSHETTSEWIRKEESFKRSLEANGTTWLPRQPFTRFAHWLSHADFVLADSGGNQQECTYLGIPCLLLRMKTEQEIPADRSNVVLSRFDESLISNFLKNPSAMRKEKTVLDRTPADIAFEAIRKRLD